MLTAKIIKASFAFGAIGMAACVNAQISLIVVSDGLQSDSGSTVLDTESVVAQTPTLGLTSYAASFGDFTGTGTAVYGGTSGALTIAIDYSLPSGVFYGTSGSHTGTWTYVSGTGIFAGLTGGGTLGNTFLGGGPTYLSGTELSGTLNAVPEPAPLAALGVGALGLLIRRRKA